MRRRASPFSLTELIVALAILGMGMTFLVQLYQQANTMARTGRHLTLSALLAQQKMEEAFLMRSRPVTLPHVDEGQGTGPYAGYQWRREITDSADDGEQLMEVHVAVSWKIQGRSRSYDVRSRLRKGGSGTL